MSTWQGAAVQSSRLLDAHHWLEGWLHKHKQVPTYNRAVLCTCFKLRVDSIPTTPKKPPGITGHPDQASLYPTPRRQACANPSGNERFIQVSWPPSTDRLLAKATPRIKGHLPIEPNECSSTQGTDHPPCPSLHRSSAVTVQPTGTPKPIMR